jgi:sodium transport system permease protein
MRGALLVCKKEFMELSKDRKTMFFTFLMPFILYPLLFGMLGKLIQKDSADRKGRPSRVLLVDPAGVVGPILKADAKAFELVTAPQGDVNQAIRDQKLEMKLEVEPEAGSKLKAQQTFSLNATYDKSDDASGLAVKRLKETMEKQNTAWVQGRLSTLGASKELALPSRIQTTDAGNVGLVVGKALGAFLPYMIMLMMFAGSMQHGIYATAGEKERGTLLSLLSTSLPRNQIIWGKLIYVFAIGLISVVINLASMGISMGQMIPAQASVGAATAAAGGPGLGALSAIASPVTLTLTFLLMIPLGLLFANFIVLMGTQAKNTVEAGTAVMPGFMVVIVAAVFSMAPGIEKLAFLPYVPILNVSLAVRKMFSQQGNPLEYAIAFAMTVGLAGILTWLSTRLLNRESVLFKV